jgi:RNA 2',3'-cyclic 3'-phosphodiesterase
MAYSAPLLVCSTLVMRIFVALDLDPEIRKRIFTFMEQVRGYAGDVRWVSEESLHVTLKFIGEKPDSEVKRIQETLAAIRAEEFQVAFGGMGFFPNPKAARVFWVGIEEPQDPALRQNPAKGWGNPGLVDLAKTIDGSLTQLGIAKEAREFSPHLTLARAKGGSGAPGWRKGDKESRQFAKLQTYLEKLPAPEFGTMTAREFFLYQSQLSSKGARYTKIARFELYARTP